MDHSTGDGKTMNKSIADALSVAIDVAHEAGLRGIQAVPLRSTNNVVAWLSPSPIVAKVGYGRLACLQTELQVAIELSSVGGPVVSPASEIPAIVHSRRGLDVTFWRYHPQQADLAINEAAVAVALRRLHAAMSGISPTLRSTLPSFLQELESARSLLADAARIPALPEVDRLLLANTLDQLKTDLLELAPARSHAVIHGSPHFHNVLLVGEKAVFIDFETTCTGPIEWDLAHMAEEVEVAYGAAVNERLMWICRGMASVKTAAFCWADVDRGDLREHAEGHLSHVRESVAPYL